MNHLTRRVFLATSAALPTVAAPRKMTIQLSAGSIGVKADQWQCLDFAARFGFESIDAYAAQLASMSAADLDRDAIHDGAHTLAWDGSKLTRFEKGQILLTGGFSHGLGERVF